MDFAPIPGQFFQLKYVASALYQAEVEIKAGMLAGHSQLSTLILDSASQVSKGVFVDAWDNNPYFMQVHSLHGC